MNKRSIRKKRNNKKGKHKTFHKERYKKNWI